MRRSVFGIAALTLGCVLLLPTAARSDSELPAFSGPQALSEPQALSDAQAPSDAPTLPEAAEGREGSAVQPLSPGGGAPGAASGPTASSLSADALALDDGGDETEAELGFSREGAYLGLGGSYAVENFSIPGNQDDAATVMFRAGYRGYAAFAVELLGEVLTTFDGSDSQDNDVNGYAVTVNAKLLAPLGRFEPWAMVGIGFLDVDEDRHNGRQDDFAFRSALGLDVYLTPHWALYGEAAYMLPTGDVKRYDYATLGGGVLFRF